MTGATGGNGRVLRAITRLNVGGPARQAVYLHRGLKDLGWEPHLITGAEAPWEGRIDPGIEGVTQIPTLRRRVDPRADLDAYRRIERFISAWRPDVVHTHLAKAGALGRAAAARARELPPAIVHTFHGHVLEGYFSRPVEAAFVRLERRLAKRTDALLTVSAAIRDELLELRIGRPEQYRIVPVGVDLASLLHGSVDPATARATLQLPARGPLVGIVGRLVPIKDLETFLSAATRIAHVRPEVTFVVAGDGELRAKIEQRAQRMLGDRVRFLGWVQDLPALYAALDLVVLTSRNEGTPTALIEAGAAGRAVVATHVGGVADVVVPGRTGELVPAGDPAAVAAAVGRLLDDPSAVEAMGAAARNHVRGKFSAERLASDLSSLYEELLSRRDRT